MGFFNTKTFLTWGGWILVILGLLGFFLIGPGTDALFGATWWFDNLENWAHLILGIVALVLVYLVKHDGLNKWVTIIVGLAAIAATITGFMNGTFLGAGMEMLDNILHLVVGIWALGSGFAR
ncbi:MAG: hypothetical protein Q7R96_01065 [Nanoarchaeota archaeon]|nr:hypothetical protein [Nanoarchaeota archaeon]